MINYKNLSAWFLFCFLVSLNTAGALVLKQDIRQKPDTEEARHKSFTDLVTETITDMQNSLVLQTDTEKGQFLNNKLSETATLYREGSKITSESGVVELVVPTGYLFMSKGEGMVMEEFLDGERYDEEQSRKLFGILYESATPDKIFQATNTIYLYEDSESGYMSDEDANEINTEEFAIEVEKSFVESQEQFSVENRLRDMVWLQKPKYTPNDKSYMYSRSFSSFEGDKSVNTNFYKFSKLGNITALVVASAEDTTTEGVSNILNLINQAVSFTEGNRYEDYKPGVDKKASMTIAGLAAGALGAKFLAKAGLVAIVLKFGKFLIIPLFVFWAKIKDFILKLFKKS